MAVTGGTVVVTGASRGIGRAIACGILERGGSVVAVARKRELLESLGPQARVHPVVADLEDSSSVDRILAEALEAFGSIDGLVNCAGFARYRPVGQLDASTVEAQLAVNLVTPLLLAQAVGTHLRGRQAEGAIVNVSSTLSEASTQGMIAYAASKAALNAATKGLALELAPARIRVNAVLPGVVNTDMVKKPRVAPGEEPSVEEIERRVEAQLEALRVLHPLGRLGTPEEVAEVVLQVLDNEWQTGSLVVLDGGLLLS